MRRLKPNRKYSAIALIVAITFGLLGTLLHNNGHSAEPSYRVGVLRSHTRDQKAFEAFLDRLRELGYEEGRNLRLVVRMANNQVDRLPALAAELVTERVDVILAVNTPGSGAAVTATRTVPVVMAIVGDPVAAGFVPNLSRPGGNVTGQSIIPRGFTTKRLELLKDTVPSAQRIALLLNPNDPITLLQVQEAEHAAAALGVEVRSFPTRTSAEVAPVFEQIVAWRADAAIGIAGQTVFAQQALKLAAKHRLPTMVLLRRYVESGGLISYFPDFSALYRIAAKQVARILQGAKPGDIPIEQPTRFELAVNLKTAKQLGLTIPPSILVLADVVIR